MSMTYGYGMGDYSHTYDGTDMTDAQKIAELTRVLKFYVANVPAFRAKPIGAPGSDARLTQEAHIQAEDYARYVLATSGAKS